MSFESDSEGERVTGARVRDFDGNSATVRAGVFVLACGGIENSRLLLHFNAESEGRLIKQPAQAQRCAILRIRASRKSGTNPTSGVTARL